jgi:pimeloyl-ACP methyl ester carboxylesterase
MKPTIIFLHGLLGNLSNWTAAAEYFRKLGFPVSVPEMPLYDEHREPILDYLVSWLDQYSRDLGELVPVGNSLGGHVAVLFAHRFPERVRALVLTGSSGLYENNALGSFPRRHSYTYIRDKVQGVFHPRFKAEPALVDEVFATVNNNRKCFRIIKTARTAQRNYVLRELPEITRPVLLLWGREDAITPPSTAEEFAALLPDARLVWLEECGHAPMMEKPAEFNAAVLDFLEEICNIRPVQSSTGIKTS